MVRYDIDWTEESEEHIARHNVTTTEVEEVLAGGPIIHGTRGSACLLLGRTDAGRHLGIVVADSGRGGRYVVTARDMSFAERRLFKRRMGA